MPWDEEHLASRGFFDSGLATASPRYARTPWEHFQYGLMRTPQVMGGAMADASGWSFVSGSFWKARETMANRAVGPRATSFQAPYYKLRARGYSVSQARAEMAGARSGKSIVRGGRFIGAAGLYGTLSLGMESDWGLGYGFLSEVVNAGISAGGARMGWAAGATVGGLIGGTGAVGGGAAMAGAVIGGVTGAIVPALAFHYAMEEGPKLGYRLSRRGFGNLNGVYRDNRQVATMRQASLAAMSQSHMNARAALGGEAALLHFA